MLRLRSVARLLLLLLLPCVAQPVRAADDPKNVTLTILHDNDLHGHLLPFAYTEKGRSPEEQPSVGGAARRATLVRQLRAAAKNPTILIDSGDTFTRGPFTIDYLGIADTEAMDAIGYELAAIGNNEFKAKDATEARYAAGAQAALLSVVKWSRFPWICANLTDARGAPLDGVKPFVIRKFGPLRVGFLGLTAPRSARYDQVKQGRGWKIDNPIKVAQEYIPKIRAQCDVLIAVTHIGVDMDKQLAAQTSGLDAIVGGDTHTFLYSALSVKSADGKRNVPIVQDGEFGVNLGKFDLHFTRAAAGWRLADYRYALLPIGPGLAEAPDVTAALAPYAEPLMQVVAQIPADRIGKTQSERRKQTAQIIGDALRRQTGADLSLTPTDSGFIEVNPERGFYFEVFRSPDVRQYDLNAIMPFKNHAAIANLTGAQIQKMLSDNADSYLSGADASSLSPEKTYRVAFMDYIATALYRVDKLPNAALTDTNREMREIILTDLNAAARR